MVVQNVKPLTDTITAYFQWYASLILLNYVPADSGKTTYQMDVYCNWEGWSGVITTSRHF